MIPALVIIVWSLSFVFLLVLLLRAMSRPVTQTDIDLDTADRELDEIERACRQRHPSEWRHERRP